ncbi:hypothetical protein SRHO_G00297260 [Serrasalmus rhombeus]
MIHQLNILKQTPNLSNKLDAKQQLQIEKLEQACAQVNKEKWQVQDKREAEKERHQLQQKVSEASEAQMKEEMGASVKEMVLIKRRFQAEMDSRALEFESEKDNMTNENQRWSTTVTLSFHLRAHLSPNESRET